MANARIDMDQLEYEAVVLTREQYEQARAAVEFNRQIEARAERMRPGRFAALGAWVAQYVAMPQARKELEDYRDDD